MNRKQINKIVEKIKTEQYVVDVDVSISYRPGDTQSWQLFVELDRKQAFSTNYFIGFADDYKADNPVIYVNKNKLFLILSYNYDE